MSVLQRSHGLESLSPSSKNSESFNATPHDLPVTALNMSQRRVTYSTALAAGAIYALVFPNAWYLTLLEDWRGCVD